MSQVITVSEAADILNLHPKTVRNYLRSGLIPAVKTGKSWRIRRDDLEKFLAGGDQLSYQREFIAPEQAVNNDTEQPELHTVQKHTETYTPLADQQPTGERLSVSAVVTFQADDKEEALRISNSFLAVFNSGLPEAKGAHCNYVYYPETQLARYIIQGSAAFVSDLLKLFSYISTPQRES